MIFLFQGVMRNRPGEPSESASGTKEPDIERLLETYSKPLTRLCYLYLKDEQLAQEAVQDTFFRAYRKYDTFLGKSSEKTWITRIAINICKDYMKKASYREIVSNQVVELSAHRDGLAYTDHDSVELLHMVYQLPTEYREVILMRYYQELAVSEIADILGQKPNTVSVRLKRAREMLKLEWGEQDQ